jgi:porin
MSSGIHRVLTRHAVPLLPLIALVVLAIAGPASAQPVAVPETYGGDLWSRPRLTGSWGGLRDQMAQKGVSLDVDVILAPQGVASGGRDTGAEFWGNAEYTLGVDTGKLGLWPGGFLNVYAISGFGDPVNRNSAAVLPVNTATLLPAFGEQGTGLMNLTFMQFLSEKFGFFLGKVNTLSGDTNEFASGYRERFMNLGLSLNAALALFPLSAYGGGIVALPWDGVVLTASLVDPSGTPTNNDISEAFKDGVLVAAEGRVTIKPFGLVGHQLVGFGWSNKERLSLRQEPSNLARLFLTEQFPRLANPGPALERIIARFFPELLVPTAAPNRERDTWSVYYNFDQFLWSPKDDPTKGIGVFFRFGVSDGEANPIKYAFNVGIGGKGIVPSRPRDTFGIGWARTEFSDHLAPFLRKQLGLGLEREDAVEMYYNAALTGWLNATLDLQIVEPGLKKVLDSSSGRLKDVDTAVVVGLRLYARF